MWSEYEVSIRISFMQWCQISRFICGMEISGRLIQVYVLSLHRGMINLKFNYLLFLVYWTQIVNIPLWSSFMFTEIKLPWIFHYVLHMLKDIETWAKTPASQYCFECWVVLCERVCFLHSAPLKKAQTKVRSEVHQGRHNYKLLQMQFNNSFEKCFQHRM